MNSGTTVKNIVTIQSDDRENGIEDGTPIIVPGTTGTVMGKSSDLKSDDAELKQGAEDSLVVKFNLPDGQTWSFDCLPTELERIDSTL